MYLPTDQERTFITQYLAPTLRNPAFPTGVLGYDHNRDVTSYPELLYTDNK